MIEYADRASLGEWWNPMTWGSNGRDVIARKIAGLRTYQARAKTNIELVDRIAANLGEPVAAEARAANTRFVGIALSQGGMLLQAARDAFNARPATGTAPIDIDQGDYDLAARIDSAVLERILQDSERAAAAADGPINAGVNALTAKRGDPTQLPTNVAPSIDWTKKDTLTLSPGSDPLKSGTVLVALGVAAFFLFGRGRR